MIPPGLKQLDAGWTDKRFRRLMTACDATRITGGNLMNLANQVALVTGAGQGIGARAGGGRLACRRRRIPPPAHAGASNVAYAASKGAVISLTKLAALQLARHNINTICPRVTRTALSDANLHVRSLTRNIPSALQFRKKHLAPAS